MISDKVFLIGILTSLYKEGVVRKGSIFERLEGLKDFVETRDVTLANKALIAAVSLTTDRDTSFFIFIKNAEEVYDFLSQDEKDEPQNSQLGETKP